MDDLVQRDGLYYEKYTDAPFTGNVIGQQQGKISKGIQNGEWIEYWDNGKLKLKGNVKNGQQEGEVLYYYENGKLEIKGNFKNGKVEGEYLKYYENGQLKYKSNHKDGKQEGEWLYYYDNGQLQFKSNYKETFVIQFNNAHTSTPALVLWKGAKIKKYKKVVTGPPRKRLRFPPN